MKPAIALLLFLGMVPLLAQEAPPPLEPAALLAIDGDMTWPIGISGQAVGWSLDRPHRGVTVSARLGNGGGHAYADVYLMKSIGPGTTEKDEIAYRSLDLVYPYEGWTDLFVDVDLEAGTYWLIVARPRERAHSSINWFVALPMWVSGSCGAAHAGSRSYTFHSDAAEYIPASKFEEKYQPYGFQFEVSEMRAAGSLVCPSY